jgi:hypothetical protein
MKVTKFISSGLRVDRWRFKKIITRLNRIKKIDAHRNGTITAEKYFKLQEF